MSWYVEGVIRKCVNVLNHIRWAGKESMAKIYNEEELRRYINNSEEIIFAQQFTSDDLSVSEPIRSYLEDARIQANTTPKKCYETCGNQMAGK